MIVTFKTILYALQVLAFLVALFRQKKNKKGLQGIFVYFLGFVLLTEFSANYVRIVAGINNTFIYNIFNTVSLIFYMYWLQQYLRKKWIRYLYVGFIAATLIEAFFTPWKELLKTSFYLGVGIIFFMTIFYLLTLLKKEEVIQFYRKQSFWISTGILIYHIGVFPLILLLDVPSFNKVHFQFALMFLNIFLYALITVGLLCPLKR
ncbi:hypothetical protein [Luteirhabdus pelagi]|uniref:hypothetical protein n=1 Tax=Luteirhabdus pelagi TaxID=2792783 RepID=UPI001939BA0A|nr:hypothetical protein [Luteirhabdus pelagi]